jgi:hypothetical protein
MSARWDWLQTWPGRLTYVLGLVASIAIGVVVFGWQPGYWLGPFAFTGIFAAVAVVGLVREVRRLRRGGAEAGGADDEPQPDWLAIGSVEVRVTGTRRRYLARFAASGSMTAPEQEVADALALLGMPAALVTTLGRDEPAPVSAPGAGAIECVEIPQEAVRMAKRARRKANREANRKV